jgi:PBP1b-binding outer membrane lipoprotein LpoB
MKQTLSVLLLAATIISSCSKKSNPKPTTTNVIEYDFTAAQTNDFLVIYEYGNDGAAENVINSNSWSMKINIPDTTKTTTINFSAAQEPPYTNNNSGTVTIKLNGKVVATGSGQFTNSRALAAATYTYNAQ